MTAQFIFYPEDYGTIAGDGSSDDSAAINAAIQACGDAGGGEVHCLSPVYGLDATVVVDRHNVYLKGRGRSWMSYQSLAGVTGHWTPYGGTVFQAKAALDPMLFFRPVYSGTTGTRLAAPGIGGIALDALTVGKTGVIVESVVGGRFDDITVDNATDLGLWIRPTDVGNLQLDEPRDAQWNDFGTISIGVWQAAAYGCLGVLISGDSVANVCMNHFSRISIAHKNNAGMKIGSSDANVFDQVLIGRWPGGTWGSLYFMKGSGTADFPRYNHFNYIEPGAGIAVAGSGTLQPFKNTLVRYSTGNGSPTPGAIAGLTILNVG